MKKKIATYGSYTKVMNGTAKQTPGRLKKKDIVRKVNNRGWTSIRLQNHGKKMKKKNGFKNKTPKEMAIMRKQIGKRRRKNVGKRRQTTK